MSSALLVSSERWKKELISMRKRKIYFQQVPVEFVRKIAERQDLKIEVTSPNVVIETPDTKTEPYSQINIGRLSNQHLSENPRCN